MASIVKAHGGFITIRSALGEGTELAVYLPALPPGSQLPAPKGIKVRLMENECFINPGQTDGSPEREPGDGSTTGLGVNQRRRPGFLARRQAVAQAVQGPRALP